MRSWLPHARALGLEVGAGVRTFPHIDDTPVLRAALADADGRIRVGFHNLDAADPAAAFLFSAVVLDLRLALICSATRHRQAANASALHTGVAPAPATSIEQASIWRRYLALAPEACGVAALCALRVFRAGGVGAAYFAALRVDCCSMVNEAVSAAGVGEPEHASPAVQKPRRHRSEADDAMERAALLAVLLPLAAAAAAAPEGEPAADAAFAPLAACGAPGVPGGWQPAPVDDEARALAALALAKYSTDNGAGGGAKECPAAAAAAAAAPVTVTRACRQVVAGTNWVLEFQAPALACADGAAVSAPAMLQARVFVPLPYTNAAPQILAVRRFA